MTARDLARQVLRRVEQGEAYATLALGGALARTRLEPADRGLATELVYGVLRHRARLDRALAAHAARGLGGLSRPALIALRVAAYQLLELRVPAHAAVDDAVDAVRAVSGAKVAGFANAVLRRLATAGEPPAPSELGARLEAVYSLPAWLAARLRAAVDDPEALAAALLRPPPVFMRVPLWRAARADVAARLARERPAAQVEPVARADEALLVRGAGSLDDLPLFREGLATVQDLAAQLVGRLCGARPGETILDACAGVGGKSTHLAELARAAGGRATIHAADASRRKLDLAEDGARRLGLDRDEICPIQADLTAAQAPLAESYDRVLLDAPCSGLGVLRRHPEAKWRRRSEDIAPLADLQRRLLAALAPRVRAGGVLVYSVCTFTAEEGADQIARFVAERPEFSVEETLRTWPHIDDADAFFAVRFRRR